MLHMHGDNDQSVPFNQSELLHAALKKVGASTELYRVKDGGHGFRDSVDSPESLFELLGRILRQDTQVEEL